MKTLAFVLSLLLSTSSFGQIGPQTGLPKLTSYEEGITIGVTHTMYTLGLLTWDEYSYTTGIQPYLCWPFPVEWDVFYGKIKYEVQIEVKQMSSQERKAKGENFKYLVFEQILSEYGCGDWGY